MTLETAEALEDLTMSTDGTAYIVTTIALLGGVLAFYYFYIYNNPEEVHSILIISLPAFLLYFTILLNQT